MQIEQWIDTKLGQDIWNKKYRFNGETFDEWLDRVSGGNEDIKQLIINKKFLFGGRTLSNRNTGKNASYSNCYSSGYVPDSLQGIMELNTNLALTYKSQGGQGLSLSKIRPKGTPIGGQFESDGIIPFMRIFNATTEGVSQGGSRKGALMMSLAADHSEIEDFISIKTKENSITKANLSVEIDDDFMEAVKKFYDTGEVVKLNITKDYEGNIVEYELTPINIYKKIMQNAYEWAEPGVILVKRFRTYNLMEYIVEYEIVTGNPCFTGDMQLLTSDGYKTFEELEGKTTEIVNADGVLSTGNIWCSGEKDVVEISLSNKQKIKCTPDHIFLLNDGTECKAKDVKGKRVQIYYGKSNPSNDLFVQLGFLQGDGNIGRINSDSHLGLEVNIGYKDKEIFSLFNLEPVEGKRAFYINGFNDLLIKYGFDGSPLPERVFPITYTSWSKDQKANFLKGCFSANGGVIKTHRVSYKATSKVFILQLQKALLEFGITANITTNKAKKIKFNNGEYLCKESYDLNINKLNDIVSFYQYIGFAQQYKMDHLVELIKIKSPVAKTIKQLPEQKVYDFNEPLTHWGVVEGLVVHNCGEQPLPKNGACNLGSMNLSEYVMLPHTDKAYFDFETFNKDVAIATEALDEVLDQGMKLHALEEQRQMAYNYRNIGLGIMGLGDMFFKLGVTYGSSKSKLLLHNIMRSMFISAVWASADLAVMKGTFPKYSDKVFDSQIIKDHFDEAEIKSLKAMGLRNCSLLSIAPSGSIGTMLDVTTGIEPAFQLSYKRKTESLHKDQEVYYDVFVNSAKEYMDLYKTEELPDYFVTVDNIHWKDRIDIQSIAQNHVDTAISSTINLPQNTTIEEVEQLYLYAWEQGLKGVTIYRKGCKRDGILTDSKPIAKQPTPTENTLAWGTTIASTDDLIGRKKKIMSGCGSLHVQAWFDPSNGKLTELYLSKGSQGVCNSWLTSNSRIVSAALRTGVSFDYLIDQLKSAPTCPSYAVRSATKHDTSKGNSCPVAVANALVEMQKEVFYELGIDEEEVEEVKQPIKVVEVTTPKNKCPECDGELKFEGGCNSCPSCGFSKCE